MSNHIWPVGAVDREMNIAFSVEVPICTISAWVEKVNRSPFVYTICDSTSFQSATVMYPEFHPYHPIHRSRHHPSGPEDPSVP